MKQILSNTVYDYILQIYNYYNKFIINIINNNSTSLWLNIVSMNMSLRQ